MSTENHIVFSSGSPGHLHFTQPLHAKRILIRHPFCEIDLTLLASPHLSLFAQLCGKTITSSCGMEGWGPKKVYNTLVVSGLCLVVVTLLQYIN